MKIILETILFVNRLPDSLSGWPHVTREPLRVEKEVDKDTVLVLLVVDVAKRVLVVVVQIPQSQIGRHFLG